MKKLILNVPKNNTKCGPKQKEVEIIITKNNCYECVSHFINDKGYPVKSKKGKPERLSRIVYESFNGNIPDGMIIRHTCDNTLCINKDHLILGTYQDNSNDMTSRNRQAKNEKSGMSKLLDKNVRLIKKMLKKGIKQLELSKLFKVHQTTISKIKLDKTWKDI